MRFYNKIMLYFWLFAAIVIFLVTSYMSITEGVKKWGFYYIFVVTSLMMFFFKKWMVKRMEKHLDYLAEEHQKESEKS